MWSGHSQLEYQVVIKMIARTAFLTGTATALLGAVVAMPAVDRPNFV